MSFVNYLDLPKDCLLHRRIPLKTIYEIVTPIQRKQLDKHISSIILVALIDEETSRIRSFRTEEESYESIQFFELKLKTKTLPNDTFDLLHSIFPNPTVFVIEEDTKVLLSCALKRINQNDKTRTTLIGSVHSSPVLLSGKLLDLIKQLNINKIKIDHLKDYYECIYQTLIFIPFLEIYDFILDFNKSRNYIKERIYLLQEYNLIKIKLEDEYKKASSMSQQMDIHMLIQKNKQELDRIVNEMREEYERNF